MPPALALFIGFGAVIWLFRRDRVEPIGSKALWIPALWIAILGSRPVAYWFGILGLGGGSSGDLEGSPINTAFFLALILGAILVLRQRDVRWGEWIRSNRALFAIYFFFALSALWSEYPIASWKRLIKDFGCVLVAMVLLTERDPMAAIRGVFVRVSFVLLPLSVVFIRYFPAIGRSYSNSGEPMHIGVTTHKNTLGQVVFVLLFFILIDLLALRKTRDVPGRKWQLRLRYGMLALGAWLLWDSRSMTAMACAIIGLAIFWASKHLARAERPGRAFAYCAAAACVVLLLEGMFQISTSVLSALGRDQTLTGRTAVWEAVQEQDINPVIGVGFCTFWSTSMAKKMRESLDNEMISSHNGYLELYVDGGLVAIALFGLLALKGVRKALTDLVERRALARISLVFWATAMLYNVSESSFFRLSLIWFTWLVMVIERPSDRKGAGGRGEVSDATRAGRRRGAARSERRPGERLVPA